MGISSSGARALAVVLALAGAGSAHAQVTQGGALPLPIFPPDNWWNADVSAAPVDAASAAYIAFIGASRGLHPDFGGDVTGSYPETYGMPYVVVPGDQPLEPVAFDYADESDPGAPGRPAGYPIPVEARTEPHYVEGGYPGNCDGDAVNSPCAGDRHMLILDRDHRLLYETWATRCLPAGSASCSWSAGSGAVFSLDSDHRRPDGWTSADAAGLAVLPGLVRYDEVSGPDPIRHAFRVTVSSTNGDVYPASHRAGSTSGALPMGARLRLKAGKDISAFPGDVRKIFQAMKTYGIIVADNGSSMYVQGTYDTRWNNDVLNPAFSSLHASDFEVLELGWTPPPLPPAPLKFYTLAPCRLFDTRQAPSDAGAPALWPGWERTFVVAGRCGVPASARAVSGNVTVVRTSAAGDLRLFPGDASVPLASTVNFRIGETRANNLILGLSSTGTGTFTILSDSALPTDALFDVSGYLQ